MKIQALLLLTFLSSTIYIHSEDYRKLFIEYGQSQGDKIRIENGILYYSYSIGTETIDKNPASGNTKAIYKDVNAPILPEDVNYLIGIINKSGWKKLKDEYGVDAKDRNYPEYIRIKDLNSDKKVTYRSGITRGTSRPAQFDQIYKALKKMTDKYFKI